MKYRNYLMRFLKEMIEKAFFGSLDEEEASPENFEAMLEILKGNEESSTYPQLNKVVEIIWERMSELEFVAENEEEMEKLHKVFQEALNELAF